MSDFCPSCAGLGIRSQPPHELCESCGGHGRMSAEQAVLDGVLASENDANGVTELTRDVPTAILGDETPLAQETPSTPIDLSRFIPRGGAIAAEGETRIAPEAVPEAPVVVEEPTPPAPSLLARFIPRGGELAAQREPSDEPEPDQK